MIDLIEIPLVGNYLFIGDYGGFDEERQSLENYIYIYQLFFIGKSFINGQIYHDLSPSYVHFCR